MALYTRKQFADLVGVNASNVNEYLRRHKLILTDNYIDDSIEPNKSFVLKRLSKGKNEAQPQEKKEVVEEESKRLPQKSSKNRKSKPYSDDDDDGKTKNTTPFALDIEQKQLNIEKSKQDIALLKLKRDKLNGVVIPTDVVKPLIIQHTKSMTVAFKQAADRLLVRIAKKAGLSEKDRAALNGELITIINNASKESIDNTIMAVDNIVDEYSQTRGVGERE